MDEHKYARIEGISTGSLSLDLALGGAGIPCGRVTELFGPESSGKTTLALHIIANAQRKGGVAAFIDAEHALDTTWAKKLGVDVSSLLISQPSTGEEALEITEMLIRSNSLDAIVIDSVAALTPKAEIEGEMGDSHMALQARLMSQAMRKLAAVINKSKTALIFINQIRMKIGVMFGNPETTPGGRALKFYSSIRLDVRRIATIKDGGAAVGTRVRARVVKNKIAPPFRDTEFDLMFDSGISYEGDLIDMGIGCEVVEKSGAWLNYGNIRLGQGREKAKQYLVENKELCEELKSKILAAKGLL
jgi:recombination protein RecA